MTGKFEQQMLRTIGRFVTILLVVYTLVGIDSGNRYAWFVGVPISLFACWLDSRK